MKLAKVKSVVLDKALQETEKFPALNMYIAGFGGYERTEDGCFISKIVNYGNGPELEIKLSLQDYFFNEHEESSTIWEFAENLIGKKLVDIKIVKIVEL